MYIDENKKFKEIFKLNPDDFFAEKFDIVALSVRTVNRLYRSEIRTVKDLLNTSMGELNQLSGFGAKCKDEIIKYLASFEVAESDCEKEYKRIPNTVIANRNYIRKGQFDYFNTLALSDDDQDMIDEYKSAFFCLGEELVELCFEDYERAKTLSSDFKRIWTLNEHIKSVLSEIEMGCIGRTKNKVKPYIEAYSEDEVIRERLYDYCDNEHLSVAGFVEICLRNVNEDDRVLCNSFLKWIKFDINKEISTYIDELKKNERSFRIIELRSKNKTLEQVSREFGITRERIRQIESKVVQKFCSWRSKMRILPKICADRNGDIVLTASELETYFGEYLDILFYLLKNTVQGDVIYDSQLQAFVIGEELMPERVQEYIDTLPETINISRIDGYIHAASELGLTDELVRLAIEENYNRTGDTYHRSRLSLATLYGDILRRYYPEGIHIYDSKELNVFKGYIYKDYGIEIDKSDHAIGATIMRIGMLCGRGIYRLNDRQFISDELLVKMHDYIVESDMPVFMTNTIFSLFEDELVEQGIDNKYFLQGVLRQKYNDEWNWKRDYISKDDSFTTFYASIIDYIRKSIYPVKKEELFRAFPGITEIVINISVGDSDIVNLFGSYVHKDNLRINENDIKYLKNTINEHLIRKSVCHIKDIYEYINYDYPTLLTNNYMDFPFSLFSLIECYFSDEYSFSRPFIANNDTEIVKSYDMLKAMICDSDRMEIAEIKNFAKSNHHLITSILEFVDSCNETHILANKAEIVSIDICGITESIYREVESLIQQEIVGTMFISQLKCIHSFPKINETWNEWLIYSLIKKWGNAIEVTVSSNKYSNAKPLVSKKGEMDLSFLENAVIDDFVSNYKVDDLNDIDELIGDYILGDDFL